MIFSRGYSLDILLFFFSPVYQEKFQTKCGILDQVHVPVAFVFYGDPPKSLCQREERTADPCCRLKLGPETAGQRATGWSCRLRSASQSTYTRSQNEHTSGQANQGRSHHRAYKHISTVSAF